MRNSGAVMMMMMMMIIIIITNVTVVLTASFVSFVINHNDDYHISYSDYH